MRVTQNSMSRNYINNLNSTLVKYNKSMDKVSSGRRFTKMSESVADGSRALRLRAQIYKNEQMQRNLSTVQEELNVAETNMMSVKGVLDTAHEQALKVQNGINEPDNEYQIYSSVFNSYKDQVFQWSNAVYGDKYIFGGTNNGGYPFSLNSSGEMEYNGVNVNDISKDSDGNFVFGTPPEKVPYSGDIYVDVGLNLSVDGGKLDKKTALNISVSGLDSFGYGTTNVDYLSVDGTMKNYDVPNNIYVIFDEMAKALDVKDMDKFAALDLQLTEQSRRMMVEVADLGVRGNYLTSTLSRYEDEELTLIEMQTNVEKINDSEEITTMRSHEYSWQLTLQFGSSFLPQSLMDYLR